MKPPFLVTGLAVILATVTTNSYPGLAESQHLANLPNQATFFCNEMLDPAIGEKVPMTIAWVKERQTHVRFIGWKSEAFGKNWTAQKRCEVVSKKFQKFYEAGKLEYLTTGINNGYPVICAVKLGETCNNNNQLFTVKYTEDPQQVLKDIIALAEGQSSAPIWQSTGNKSYLNVNDYLKNATAVDIRR